MGQQISSEKLKMKFADVVVYSFILNKITNNLNQSEQSDKTDRPDQTDQTDQTDQINEQITYKQLLSKLLNLKTNKKCESHNSNIITKSYVDSHYIYCNKIYSYKINFSHNLNKLNNLNNSNCPNMSEQEIEMTCNPKVKYFLKEMDENKEYIILDVFYNILKHYNIHSLDVPIHNDLIQIISLTLNKATDYYKNLLKNQNASDHNDIHKNISNEISNLECIKLLFNVNQT